MPLMGIFLVWAKVLFLIGVEFFVVGGGLFFKLDFFGQSRTFLR